MPVHFVMQAKGGAGKSTVAAYLFQYFQQRGDQTLGFDIDPSNHTFAGYKAFEVQRIEVMSGNEIDQRKFDDLINAIVTQNQDAQMVVDVGASGFAQLCAYIIENDIFSSLRDLGYAPVIHSLVVGGAAIMDSVASLKTLAGNFSSVPLAVWVNTYFGPAVYKDTPYYNFAVWQEIAPAVKATIQFPVKSASTFGVDLREMATRRLSFAEVLEGQGGQDAAQFGIMPRQRLKTYWRELYESIDRCLPPFLAGL